MNVTMLGALKQPAGRDLVGGSIQEPTSFRDLFVERG